jgi:hypothetical protein
MCSGKCRSSIPKTGFFAFSMPHLKLLAPSILLFVAVAHSEAVGQSVSSPYTFIEYGQAWAVFAGKSDLNPGQLGLGPRDATTFGGRYAVAFSAMNLDIDGTYFMSKRDVLDVSRPADDRFLGKTDIDLVLLDLRLRLNLTGQRAWHGLQPFILFGGGLAFATSTERFLEVSALMPEDEWYDFGKAFAGTFGAGASFHLSSKISLRLDGVVNLWKVSTPVGWLTVENDPNGENLEDEWVSARTIRLGAAWRF